MKFKALLLSAAIAVSAVSLVGCGNNAADDENQQAEAENTTEEAAAESEENTTEADLSYLTDIENYGLPQLEEPAKGSPTATISTTMGDIKVVLYPDFAPVAVENFLGLASEGYYDGVIFHRVIDEFMIQGGDPTGTGTGGESYFGEDFGLETTPSLRHFRGALSMANTGEENSNGSQFFIVQQTDIGDEYKAAYEEAEGMQDEEIEEGSGVYFSQLYPTAVLEEYINNGGSPFLDNSYSVFGQVIDGMDVVDAIAKVETDENDKPLDDVVINSVTIGEY